MQTGIGDPIIRPLLDTQPTPRLVPHRTTFFYDAISHQQEEHPALVMRNVQFGKQRQGGFSWLATLTGENLTEGNIPVEVFLRMKPMLWIHNRFCTPGGLQVYSADLVLIAGIKVLALNPVGEYNRIEAYLPPGFLPH